MIRVVKLKLSSLKSNLMSFNCVVFLRQNNVTAFLCSKVIHTLFTIHNDIGSFTTQYIYIKTKPINILLEKFLNT